MGFYDNMIKWLAGFFCALYRVELVGKENIPEDTEKNQLPGFMLCSNHIANLDPVVIVAAIRVKINWMAKESLFKIPVLAPLIRALGAYPVNRASGDVGAIKRTIAQLKDCKSVGIFPQGHRQPGTDPRTTEVRHGAGMIAFRSGCDVLPVAIETKSRKLKLFSKTVIIVGERIPFADLGLEEGNTEAYKQATELIFDRICALGEAYRSKNA